MRLFLRATRALISFATTAHIATLRGHVALSARQFAKAIKATDTARAVRYAAERQHRDAVAAESRAYGRDRDTYIAARAEAQSLRPGVSF